MKYARDSLSLDDVQRALKSKENDFLNGQQISNKSESLYTRVRPEVRIEKKTQRNRSRSRSIPRSSKGKCFHCHKIGQYRRDCPDRKQSVDNSNNKGDVAVAEIGYDSADVLCISNEKIDQSWVLDSGCSFHVTPNKAWFDTLQEVGGQVVLGNNKTCPVLDIGTIRLILHDGTQKILKDTRYVPELKRNLISLGALDQSGYSFKAQNGLLSVITGSLMIMKDTRSNGLYVLSGVTFAGTVANMKHHQSYTELWHRRLGHISDKGLQKLNKQGLIKGYNIGDLEFYEDCVKGKAARVEFKTAIHVTKAPLDYVHSDLWGPAKVSSNGGGYYFMSIIDDYSRMVWVYILKHKNQAFGKFKELVTLQENQIGCKVKFLRNDNGLEYCSSEFSDFCKSKGIARHLTVPGTPQQNGLAERMNRTILERVRSMLSLSGQSNSYWVKQ